MKVRVIDEAVLDQLILDARPRGNQQFQILNASPPKNLKDLKALNSTQKNYNKLLNNINDETVKISSDYLQENWEKHIAEKYSFFDAIDPQINEIIYNSAPNMETYIDKLYDAGKQAGFKEMQLDSFFGESDKHALYTLQNYNFDLVKNANTEMRNGIREAVWEGTARGDSLQTIADQILQIPMTPVQAGNRMISPEERSILISRTESMRAMNQGHLLAYQQAGMTQVDIDIGDPDDECADFPDGNPWDINDPNLPILPAHPNCECNYIPVKEEVPEGVMDPDVYVNLVLGGETPVIAVEGV